jgi:hypothetical protein
MNDVQFEQRISALENETTEQYKARLEANDAKADAATQNAAEAEPTEEEVKAFLADRRKRAAAAASAK